MPLTIKATTTDLPIGSLLGSIEALLSADAIRDPGQHLHGSKRGSERNLIINVVHPHPELLQEILESLEAEITDLSAYGASGLLFVRLNKAENTPVVPADLSRK